DRNAPPGPPPKRVQRSLVSVHTSDKVEPWVSSPADRSLTRGLGRDPQNSAGRGLRPSSSCPGLSRAVRRRCSTCRSSPWLPDSDQGQPPEQVGQPPRKNEWATMAPKGRQQISGRSA